MTVRRDVGVFFACAYGITWLIWLPFILGKGPPFFLYAGFFGPTIAALVTQRVLNGGWRAFRLWTSLGKMAAGMLIGSAFLSLSCFTAAIATTQSGYRLWQWPALLQIPYLFLPNLLGGPLGEEAGWRGFALPRLQASLNPVLASVVLGFFWATWHLPLYLVHLNFIPYWLYVPLLVAATVIIAFGVNLSGGSSVVAIYLHGLFNVGIGIIMNDFLGKAAIRTFPSQNIVLVGSFLGVAILLAIATRGRLGAGSGTSRIWTS